MTHAPQIGRLLLFFLADFFNDGLRWLCHRTGAVQVPARLPQVYQIGHDGPGRAALQSHGGFRQDAVWRDPQNAEGPDPCRPDQSHVRWGLEEGEGRQVKVQKTTCLQKTPCTLLFFLLFPSLAAHHLLLQRAQRNHSAGGQNRLPENHFKLADVRLHLLWS